MTETTADFHPDGSFDLLRPPGAFDWTAIALRLARIERFNAGTALGLGIEKPWSVARHSILVADRVSREAKGYALLHDAHEAFIGDDVWPKVAAYDAILRETLAPALGTKPSEVPAFFSIARAALARLWDVRIFAAAGLAPDMPAEIAAEVAEADKASTVKELHGLVRQSAGASALRTAGVRATALEWLLALSVYCPEAMAPGELMQANRELRGF